MLSWTHFLIIFAVALVATIILVPVIRTVATRFGIVDQPGPRRVNTKPIPRMGGVAMFVAFLIAVIVEIICEAQGLCNGPFFMFGGLNTRMMGVVAGLAVIVLVGAVDDVKSLSPGVKFAGQVVAAIIIAATGTLLGSMKIPFSNIHVDLGLWAYPFTVVYLVCFANVINLIDGLDGLAAGICGIASISLFLLTMNLFSIDAALLAVMMAGICIGFLVYNFYPASIFMGDSGSLLLGMLLGTISLVGSARFSSVTALAVPVVIAGVPVIDTLSAIIRRKRSGQSPFAPDAGHIHHRLLRQGFSQRKAVLVIYGWTALLSFGGCVVWSFGGVVKYAVLLALLVVSSIIVWRLGLFGPVLQHHYYPDGQDPEAPAPGQDGTGSHEE